MSNSDQQLAHQQCGGFTLLELMMVLLLIGLMAGAVLTVGFSNSPSSQRDQAEALAQQFKLASLEAVQSGNLWGLDFFRVAAEDGSQTGYRWLFNDGSRWRAADPQALDAKSNETLLPHTLLLRVNLDGSALEPELQQALIKAGDVANPRFTPEVLLLPTREFTAFTAQLCSSDNKHCDASVSVDALGRVATQVDHATR